MEPYKYKGSVDCSVDFDSKSINGKTAIVTGGVQGIGLEYVKALTNAGAFVVVGDIDTTRGEQLMKDIQNTKFIRCDVTNWDDQVELFKTALDISPNKSIDYVLANAGILGTDDILTYDSSTESPSKPTLRVTQINLIGVMYTTKLAVHHFRRQYDRDSSHETCLVLQGSLAGYLDIGGAPQYNATKYGVRGIMHSLRKTSHLHGTRVHYIAPWYIKTKILTEEDIQGALENGVEFADAADAAQAVMRFLCDRRINGRSFAIVPRSWQPRGYVDVDYDDFTPENHWLGKIIEQTDIKSQKQ